MEFENTDFYIIHVSDDIELKLSEKVYRECNNNHKCLIFDFRDHSMVIMNVPSSKEGE